MPQQLVWVREKESGQVYQMHTVDAAEGMALGDFESVADPAKEISAEERASAAAAMRSVGATPHPELQTPEQRAATRAKANEIAAMTAGVPPGASVVVQAPSPPVSAPAPAPASSAPAPASTPPAEPENPDAVRPRRH